MPTIAFRDSQLYYEAHGSGPAIVFAHGLGGNSLSWWQQVAHFSRTHTCVVWDQPGFARSGEPSGDDWNFADALEALADHLGLAHIALVGQSMGGRTCLAYALRHPERVRALVMASSVGIVRVPVRQDEARAQLKLLRKKLLARRILGAFGERGAREKPAHHFLYGALSRLTSASKATPPPRSRGYPAAGPAELARLTMPVLFLIGEEDCVIPPALIESAASIFPRVRVKKIAQAGHSIYFECPDVFNRLLEELLAGA